MNPGDAPVQARGAVGAAPATPGGGAAASATSGALGGTAVTGADGSTAQGAQPAAAPGGGGMNVLMVLMVPMLLVLILTSVMGSRKEKKKRADLMSSLKKHDKVQTIGGVIGTVVELGADEVVLRVDEVSKTRIRFSRSAIQQVLRGSGGPSETNESAGDAANNGVVEKAGV
jgi:preprotein translocase subunit YajC